MFHKKEVLKKEEHISQPCKLQVYVDGEIVLIQDLPSYLKNDLNVRVQRDCAEEALKIANKKRKEADKKKREDSKGKGGEFYTALMSGGLIKGESSIITHIVE